ncbi:MAG: heme o synthase [Candidatus Thermoplasmatota archaeon]|nr:heme o synthase [Candidatus Thermoplasmatota archaeon]
MSRIEGHTPEGRAMSETASGAKAWFTLTKPGVVVLLQITALCAVLSHDLLEASGFTEMDWNESLRTMVIVFVGGYLTAGGANAINMWYDRDIDPIMRRTSQRPIPTGSISANGALFFGIIISVVGVFWFLEFANQVAAFWAAFSILFYVFIYTIWLKRTSVQNIVIGGLAGATPPVIGWATAVGNLSINVDSVEDFGISIFDLGSLMPWYLLLLIFLWTPPHFWALALYRSEEYDSVGIPMMPGVKGASRTLLEMKLYSILLVILAVFAPTAMGGMDRHDTIYHLFGWTTVVVTLWYARTVFIIDPDEPRTASGRIPTAARSFFVSMLYLALMFAIVVAASAGLQGAILGAVLAVTMILRDEWNARAPSEDFSA